MWCHLGLHLLDSGPQGNNAEDTIAGWFSLTPASSNGSEPREEMYLGQLQGNGLQLNITLNPRAVPGPQRLLGAVSFQEGGCTHRLQDIVVTATLHASGHGLLHHKNTHQPSFWLLLSTTLGIEAERETKPWAVAQHHCYPVHLMPPVVGEMNHFSPFH